MFLIFHTIKKSLIVNNYTYKIHKIVFFSEELNLVYMYGALESRLHWLTDAPHPTFTTCPTPLRILTLLMKAKLLYYLNMSVHYTIVRTNFISFISRKKYTHT